MSFLPESVANGINYLTGKSQALQDLYGIFIKDKKTKIQNLTFVDLNSKQKILENLTCYSRNNKIAFTVSLVAIPILTILITKIAVFASILTTIILATYVIYKNNQNVTAMQKVADGASKGIFHTRNWIAAHNPFASQKN